ncbi:MAG: 50S ribosomal protein L17 [Candidatus Niyogibacteria bacterium]|nr:50S ribosomal protein L17 [Candidatus Niyogibacteria bacterium]
MKHSKKGRKFGRVKKTRAALLKSLVRAFVSNGKIETTIARAKETRSIAEKLLTKAKRGDLSSRRQIMTWLRPKETEAIFKAALRHAKRPGGYTRITRTRSRAHDRADMALLEFVE